MGMGNFAERIKHDYNYGKGKMYWCIDIRR